jgi:hypothetical protein
MLRARAVVKRREALATADTAGQGGGLSVARS